MVEMYECKVCKVSKERKLVRYSGQQPIYQGSDGRLWHRAKCAECVKEYNTNYMKARAKKWGKEPKKPKEVTKLFRRIQLSPYTSVYEGSENYTPPKLRNCKCCGAKTINYYFCPKCHSLQNTADKDTSVYSCAVNVEKR